MKIAIDTQTTLGQKSGFGFYTQNLVENLKKVAPENEYILVTPKSIKDLSAPERFRWDQFQFPKKARRERADILHQPGFSIPVFYRGKKVVTCHDIIPLKFPHVLPLFSRLFFSRWMTFSYKFADAIITDAESTKKDLMECLKLPQGKIFVIPLAASAEFHPIEKEKVAKVLQKYDLRKKYFIHVGTLEPRKNLDFLIRSYGLAVRSGIEENLVITGKKGWYYEGLFASIKELKLEKRVIFLGYVPDGDIPSLYSGATALTFPSIYEGFGLPVLEAMACGAPVVSSNTSSLPEVAGEAAILLSPQDEPAWAKAMINVSTDANLRAKMINKGLIQAKKFSWAKTAQQTLEVYQKILV